MPGESTPAQLGALGFTPADSIGLEQLRRQRIALVALILAVMFGALYLLGAVILLLSTPEAWIPAHTHPGKILHLVLVAVLGGLWLLVRRPSAHPRLCDLIDVGLALLVCTIAAAMVVSAAPVLHMGFAAVNAMLLVLTIALELRAALVPSPPVRTAIVGVVASIPVVVTSWWALRDVELPVPVPPRMIVFAVAAWCLAGVAVTTVTSRIIYGLQKKVQEAVRLGQYTLGEKIGEGGMGAVYRASHAMLRRPTAVKLLLPDRAGAENVARFEREVQLTASLTHPNTVAIFDYGRTPHGTFYYAMEYIGGVSLEQLVREHGPQSPARVIHILIQAASALAEAHGIGLIHRDVKPANILLCERGGIPDVVKVVDFGLVKAVEAKGEVALTNANSITGTPLYVAPESIVAPETVDARVDVYALGAVGYFLLTRSPPFEGNSIVEVCSHHLHTEPAPPSSRATEPVPPSLDRLILRCLQKERAKRPADAGELLALLTQMEADAPWSAPEARAWWKENRED